MSETVLHVPRRVLDPRGTGPPTSRPDRSVRTTPRCRPLTALMSSVLDGPDRSAEQGQLVVDAAVALVQTAIALHGIGQAPAPDADRLALRARVHSFIDAHLSDR